jgi:hypothetical protein
MLIKKMLWYNMYDLQMRGKDIRLSRKGVSLLLAATVIFFIMDSFLWNVEFLVDSISDPTFDSIHAVGPNFFGKIIGIASIGLLYLFIFIMVGRKSFFEQTLKEYEAMSWEQKRKESKTGKYLMTVPFVLSLLLFFYLIFFRK